MQLAISALGQRHPQFIAEILPLIRECKCSVQEIRSSRLGQATACYMLVQGNWNQIAKIETALEQMQKRLDLQIHTLRTETRERGKDSIPYTLETVSLDRDNVIDAITMFLLERDIEIEEITGGCYYTHYAQNPIFSTKFIILVPPLLSLLSLREEFLDFCDQANLDSILEPIKK